MIDLERLSTVTYTNESQIRSPKILFSQMINDFVESKELGLRLFLRDFRAQYRKSMLGFFWAIVPPIAMALVFIVLQSKKVVNFDTGEIPYPLFAIIGSCLWQLFVESLNFPLKTVSLSKSMLAKINFPRESLIISALCQSLFSLFIKLIIISIALIYFGVQVSFLTIFSLPIILMIILLGIAIGILLTPFGTLYTDVTPGITIFAQFWFFLTPVVYPAPQSFPFNLIAILNPVSPILIGARDLLILGHMDNFLPTILTIICTLILFLISWIIFRISMPIIIERISA